MIFVHVLIMILILIISFRAIHDSTVVDLLLEKDILLEICPLSNLRCGSVESIRAHPIRALMAAGVRINISSDDPGMFDTSIIDDYEQLVEIHGFTAQEFHTSNCHALNASFLDEAAKERVRAKFFSDPIFA